MNQYERMIKGLLYDANAAEIMDKQVPFQDKLWEFNKLKPSDYEKKQQYMREVFAECGDNCYIELPFRANWGGHHVHFGSGIYVNSNLTLVDDGHIYVGDKVMFGPNVIISTASHPVNPELRARGLQYNKDVTIEENAWIGAGVIILAGIRIGKNSVIGAGSVVTHDIPDNVIAVGNPCRILREISERDREFFYKEERIDWENLEEEKSMNIEWIDGFEIKVINTNDEVVISANKEGLESLANDLLELAKGNVGDHIHYDEYNSLTEGSTQLIIEKVE